ncbi:hypothetical protein EA772_01495 [Pedobacter sp. G11]|uniref:hypothetical protein n=1 Tax=Pedobacter sp. G11 TaxID=2482728 RepID=UPI000F5F8875|nr:hypothetical protein [Pedobacter sp. G11]AZI24080.1 hypothetical protein EA772_01495 [Pedobacter sp. G11]
MEHSLAERHMVLLSPSDRIETSVYQQIFWWEAMDDALFYRLQVVTPSFDSAASLVLDTLVKTDKFIFTLDPGHYQWRVRGENGSSRTEYATHAFVVYPSSLKEQSLRLNSPATGLLTSQPDIMFSWPKLFGALNYRLQIDTNNFVDESKVLLNVLLDGQTYIFSPVTEGHYQFRIRAENATENSKWSTAGLLTFDSTPPSKVNLEFPANSGTVSSPVSLKWTAERDAVAYQLFVYKSDSVSVLNNTFPLRLSANSHGFSFGNPGEKLIWRVRAMDKAGNLGPYSDYRSFFIQ